MSSRTARRSALLPSLVLVGLALAACTAPAPAATDAANDKAAAKFVACLADQGQTAKIIMTGQVGILQPDDGSGSGDPGDTGTTTNDGPSDGAPVAMSLIKDDDGTWLAADTAAGYPEEGGQRDAWTACSAKIPEFTQPAPDLGDADVQTVTKEDVTKAALAFAKCARDNDFTDFADPDQEGRLSFPAGITEDEFTALFEACGSKLDGVGVPISKDSADALGFDWMSIVQQYVPAGGAGVTTQSGGGN